MVMLGHSVNLTTLFLDRLRPPKWLTSTWCTYFRQELTTALLESGGGKTEVCESNLGPLALECLSIIASHSYTLPFGCLI